MSLEIESTDIIRLIQQFLKENNLLRTLATLQDETSVSLNTIDNPEAFKADILAGKWESVLRALSTLKVPSKKLVDLYEQIVCELIELRENVAARSLLRQTDPMQILKEIFPERYLHLETLLSKSFVVPSEIYPDGITKETRRKAVATSLCEDIAAVAPARLLTLIGQAIKWQTSQGLIEPGATFDLFKGASPTAHAEEDLPPSQCSATIKFPKKQHAEVAAFSPNGQFFVTGTVDGFIEVWNYLTGKLRKDLKYQAEDKIMLMESAVLSLSFSPDSEQLASGAQDGKIKVWNIHTGQCVRRFSPAHSQGITSISFSRDGSHLLSASFDTTIRIHGLKSGKMLKEFRGHTSYVNRAIYSADESRVISGSSDGTLRIWDAKSAECLSTFGLFQGKMAPIGVHSPTITTLLLTPKNDQHIIVSNQSCYLYTVTIKGQVIRSTAPPAALEAASRDSNTPSSPDFVTAAISRKGEFVYAATEQGRICVFASESGKLVSSF
eukprot:jgi/Hompol1/3876/HPOL_003386-RA